MDIKQILLVQSAESASDSAAVLAARLAKAHGAMVAGLCLYGEPDPSPAGAYAVGPEGVGPEGVGEVLEHRQQRVKALTAPSAAGFERSLAGRGLSDGWDAGELDTWRDVAVSRARLVDLVVADAPDGAAPSYRSVIESVALQSGTPTLLAPAKAPAGHDFKRVVLAWNGSREAKRAMDDGLVFLRAAQAVAIVVASEEATRSVDRAQTDALVRHLARHGVQADLLVSEARGRGAGDVLVEQCAAFNADLLVMGAYGRSRAAERILGGATRTILARATIATLLSH